jgi:hypothetical protein
MKGVTVYRCEFFVEVDIPPIMSGKQFDEFMVKNYDEIESVFDVADAFQEVLTNNTGVLRGFNARVRTKL